MTLFTIYAFSCMMVTLLAVTWIIAFHRKRFEKKYRHSLSAVSAAVEARTGRKGETALVQQLCTEVARQMGATAQIQKSVMVAAAVAEIGLVSIPYDQLRRRPRSSWTQREAQEYENYPDASAALLSLIPSFEHAATIVRCLRASFKPQGGYLPSGEEIPLEARILAAVKAYVRALMDQGELLARQTLVEGKGTLFDPNVTEATLRVITANGSKRRISATVSA